MRVSLAYWGPNDAGTWAAALATAFLAGVGAVSLAVGPRLELADTLNEAHARARRQ